MLNYQWKKIVSKTKFIYKFF